MTILKTNMLSAIILFQCVSGYAFDQTPLRDFIDPIAHVEDSDGLKSSLRSELGCDEFGTSLLPALLSAEGMDVFLYSRGVSNSCLFQFADFNELKVGFGENDVDGKGSTFIQALPDRRQEKPQTVVAAETVNLANGPEIEGWDHSRKFNKRIPAISDLTLSRALMSSCSVVACRAMTRHAPPLRSIAASVVYWGLLIIFSIALVVALPTVIFALVRYAYRRWFREQAILSRAVKRGLRRREFHLEYQPIVKIRNRQCVGLEAVLRWKNTNYGFRSEDWLVEALSGHPTATAIIVFVLSTAERELRKLLDGPELYLIVNLRTPHLQSEKDICKILAEARSLTTARLVFQIRDEELAIGGNFVDRLLRDKVRIAISLTQDSSLGGITPYESLEFIKIRREVMGMDESERLQALQAIAAAGRRLDAAVVAEGVEGVGQSNALRCARIQLAQGFFFGKSIPARELTRFIQIERWY